jgi:hypothetical protein
MSDLDLLGEIGQLVRRPAFDEIVETRRRRTLQTRLVVGSAATVVAIAAAGALVANGHTTGTEPPPVAPSETKSPKPTETATDPVEIPDGQQTIVADIGPGDIGGYAERATVTNTQPEHAGDTYLQTTITAHVDTEYVRYSCQAHDVPTWIAYAAGDLVSDSPGGATDSWTYRECSPDDTFSLDLDVDLTDPAFRQGLEQKTVRMFALAPPSGDQRGCLLNTPAECPVPEPIAATDAEFGFRIFEHTPSPLVLEVLRQPNGAPYQFEALGSLDGVGWLVDRAVVAAPHADRLVVELPAADEERLVDVYHARGPGFERCVADHQDELPPESPDRPAYDAAVEGACGVDLGLVVDGTTVPATNVPHRDGHFTRLGARLAPGVDHQVVVEIVRGDPRNISYAAVLRTRTELP